uniref:Uncharacterized protein n=1 Tax=Strigamia maritima TaxID=126957 RepID=T1J1Z8_STRMM
MPLVSRYYIVRAIQIEFARAPGKGSRAPLRASEPLPEVIVVNSDYRVRNSVSQVLSQIDIGIVILDIFYCYAEDSGVYEAIATNKFKFAKASIAHTITQ